jgi:hypothetical protein
MDGRLDEGSFRQAPTGIRGEYTPTPIAGELRFTRGPPRVGDRSRVQRSPFARSRRLRSDEMPALLAVSAARPPAIRLALIMRPFDQPAVSACRESSTLSSFLPGSLFLIKGVILNARFIAFGTPS